ncbi:MAG: hypothetical protein WD597_10070 [Balneolaceae bacterium]
MHLFKKPISPSLIFFIMGVVCVLLVVFVVPLFDNYNFGAPQFFALPGTVSIALFSGPIFSKRLSKRLNAPPVPLRQNFFDGIWIWGFLYFVGNVFAVIYTIFFLNMNGGGAMYPTLFLVWGFLGLPLALALGGLTGWLSHKVIVSGA